MNKKQFFINFALAIVVALLIPAALLAIARYCAWLVGVSLDTELALTATGIGALCGLFLGIVIIVNE